MKFLGTQISHKILVIKGIVMKRLIKYFFILFNFYTFSCYSQLKLSKKVNLEFRPENRNELRPDSISIMFISESIAGIYSFEWLHITPNDTSGNFGTSLTLNNKISRIRMVFMYGKEMITSNMYYVEPDDQISIEYKKMDVPMSLNFSGKGAMKYKVIDLMSRELNKLTSIKIDSNYKKDENESFQETLKILYGVNCNSRVFADRFDTWFKAVDIYKKNNQAILKEYESKLGFDMAKFLKYELDRSQENTRLRFMAHYDFARTKQCKEAIAKMYLAKVESNYDSINVDLIKYGSNFIRDKNSGIMTELFLKRSGKPYSFKDQYNLIKSTKNSDLRDRLITEFIMTPTLQYHISDFQTKDSCSLDAYNTVKSTILLKAIEEQLLFSKGRKMYNFSIPDSTGRLIKLEDLRGKVFLLDIWFEGCSGCLRFAEKLKKEIYPKFSNNPDFKVVSVNMTSTEERSHRAIKSGKYTQHSYINLNIGKEGINHPMLKHFKAEKLAFPFILLVDKNGNIVYKIGNETSLPIINMIRKALNIKEILGR